MDKTTRKFFRIDYNGWMTISDVDPERDMLDQIHDQLNGGLFEVVRCRTLPRKFVMLVDDCGLLKELPFNFVAQAIYGAPIAGVALIMCEDYDENGERDLFGLKMEDIDELMHVLRGLIVIREVNEE